ncbi:hypothetical protein CONPUDRAFT_138778 [Coniophora puteana RWD-64-598 SS2]|uniref:DUF6533 domain-containing protein n=1 Tax=Coniophora puteana (strain RWD-64-598) TaxID=741705 RepID=A0A5M3MHZ0_CONPW|nr:uncharacterized protein CONPUDRAFT_138778 [Coniophora puteana RWD-64-598 SS2]EIW78550.1 hypothetical protein CONPUDRAFT_138778 [Coniophora puteana RWD-64-598 SS2]
MYRDVAGAVVRRDLSMSVRRDETAENYYVVGMVLVTYDWLLNFSTEVDVVWRRRFSLASVLYLLLRYMSLALMPIHAVWGYNLAVTDEVSLNVNMANWLLTTLCIPCIQGIMLIRVRAVYGPSRWVHKVLIAAFVIEQLVVQIIAFMTYHPGPNTFGIESDLHGYHNCNTQFALQNEYFALWCFVQLAFEAMMASVSLYTLYQHMREIRASYRRWNWNDLFVVMVREHTFCFLLYIIWGTLNGVSKLPIHHPYTTPWEGYIEAELFNSFNFVLSYIQQYVLVPHLVLDIRQRCATSDLTTLNIELPTLQFSSANRTRSSVASNA